MAERAAYSVNEMLDMYGIGRTKLYEEIKAGRLVARKLGVKTLFFVEDIEAWERTAFPHSLPHSSADTGELGRTGANKRMARTS